MKIYDIAARPDDSFPFAAEGGEMNGLFPEHTHTYTELMVITGGRGWHVSANGRHWLTPGTVITVPPPLAHQMEEMEHLQLYVLKFDLPRLMAYDYDLKNDPGFRSLFVHCPFPQQPGSQAKPLQLDQEQLPACNRTDVGNAAGVFRPQIGIQGYHPHSSFGSYRLSFPVFSAGTKPVFPSNGKTPALHHLYGGKSSPAYPDEGTGGHCLFIHPAI